MAKADSGRVGQPDRMHQDQLVKSLDQSVRWLGNGRLTQATIGSLHIVAELANEAGWKTVSGRLFISRYDRQEMEIFNPRSRQWVRFRLRGYVPVSVVKEVADAIAAMRDMRSDELGKSALPTKSNRGRKAAISKPQAIAIRNAVIALSNLENISQNQAALRLAQTMRFGASNWPTIRKMATR